MATTSPIWDRVELFDDFVLDEERAAIKALREKSTENWCPNLRREGQFFHYCGKGVSGELSRGEMYERRILLPELNVFCARERHSQCPYAFDRHSRASGKCVGIA